MTEYGRQESTESLDSSSAVTTEEADTSEEEKSHFDIDDFHIIKTIGEHPKVIAEIQLFLVIYNIKIN